MTVPAVPAAEEPTTLDLLKQSYGEVLDATKHQDEKIGRILAAVSFLAAAAIALVNANGIGLFRQFDLDGRTLPLLAYAFVAFVIGVVFSVTLLLSSVTTSLTLPGRGTGGGGPNNKSMIYFYAISERRLDDWHQDWSDETALPARFRDNYKDETYNLAVRTNHKYRRTGEAVALLRLTLFSLGVAVILAGGVVTAPPFTPVPNTVPPPVRVGGGLTWVLAAFVAAYTFVVVLVARRDKRLEARAADAPQVRSPRDRMPDFLAFQVLPPLLAGAFVASRHDAVRGQLAGLVAAELILLVVALWPRRSPLSWALTGAFVVALGVFAVAAQAQDDVSWRWLAAVLVPVSFTCVDLAIVEQKIRRALSLRESPAPSPPEP